MGAAAPRRHPLPAGGAEGGRPDAAEGEAEQQVRDEDRQAAGRGGAPPDGEVQRHGVREGPFERGGGRGVHRGRAFLLGRENGSFLFR